ncbi:MAG: TonB-dependent receptor [Bacteroidales bacterium]
MKRKLFFFITGFLIVQHVLAQNPIRGKVISAEDKEPVIGASVIVKGTTSGVITDYDGAFSLTLPESSKTLVISYIGMQTQEVEAKNGMTVLLQTATQDIDEVIVVAYGTAKKSSFTGSAANLGKEKIEKLQVSEVSKALEGAMAGVQISSSTGQPGSSATIRVRGVGSINASSSPLIIVDGVPYEGTLNSINSQDIESMSVLKDAAANSLYGARGANGVILIATKSGKKGELNVSFENRTGVNYRMPGTYDVLKSSKEYYELFWESLRNQQKYGMGKDAYTSGIYASENLVPRLGGYNSFNVANESLVNPFTGKLNADAQLLYQDNWYDEAFQAALRQENNFTVSGGTEKQTFYVSLGYLYDDSYTAKSNLTRYSGRIKLDQQLASWARMGVNMFASTSESNIPNTGGSTNTNSIFYTGLMQAPIYPIYMRNEAGDYLLDAKGNKQYDYGVSEGKIRPFGSNANAIAEQEMNIRKASRDVLSGKLYFSFDLFKGMKFTTNLSYDNIHSGSTDFQNPLFGAAASLGGVSAKVKTRLQSINFNQLLHYDRSFGEHAFELLLGHESKEDRNEYLGATKSNFYLPDNPELDNAITLKGATSYYDTYSIEGYFAQLKYNWQDKYYLSGSYRRDGSSRFHPDVRWGNFWSVGGSWRVNQEQFMQDLTWINDLKLKSSFGTQGNDNLGNSLPYLDQYAVISGQDNQPETDYFFRGNPKISWEKSNNFNIGTEFRLWNRLSGGIEYFYKQTWDMLYAKPLPPSYGKPTTLWENTMKMYNSGIEAELSYDIFARKSFRWNVSLNMTHYKNELKELPADRQGEWVVNSKLLRQGVSLYNWYGYKYEGVDPQNGLPRYQGFRSDMDGNAILDGNGNKIPVIVNSTSATTKFADGTYGKAGQYEYGKDAIPDLYGGFSSNMMYRNFDLNISLAYQIGGWAEDTQYKNLMNGGDAGVNWHKDIYQRWTPENPSTNVPRLQEGSLEMNAASDRFLTKASYLSLRNVTLGYTFDAQQLKKLGIRNIRLYVVGDNLYLLSARKGFDPRNSFSGSGNGFTYDAVSTCSFGFNINF